MDDQTRRRRTTISWGLLLVAALLGLYGVSVANYTLFHALVDIFSALIALSIFIFAWNSRHYLEHSFLVFLGIASLFVGAVDTLHTFTATPGMFYGATQNLSTQLWLCGRLMQGASWVLAALLIGRRTHESLTFAGYLVAYILMVYSVFWWRNFPVVISQDGLPTRLETAAEALMCGLMLLGLGLLVVRRKRLERRLYTLLLASAATGLGAIICFALFVDVHDLYNFAGHYLKIVSFALLYTAIIERGMARPLGIMFQNLLRTEEELRQERELLEQRVEERTAALSEANERLRTESQQREAAEKRFELFMRHLPGLAYIKDENGKFLWANQHLLDELQRPLADVIGRSDYDLYPPDAAECFHFDDELARKMNEIVERTEEIPFGDKKRTYLTYKFAIARENAPSYVGAISRDVTDAIATQLALQRSEQRNREVVDTAGSIILSLDLSGHITFINQYGAALLGYDKPESLIGQDIAVIVPQGAETTGLSLRTLVEKALVDPSAFGQFENENLTRDGRRLWIAWSNRPMYGPDRKLEGLLSIGVDRTAQHEGEQELLANQERLRSLASELVLAEERERRRLATEIHDNLSQTLAVARLKVQTLERDGQAQALSEQLQTLDDLLAEAVANTRSITFDLSPPILYQVGLAAAIEWLGERTQTRHGIEFHFHDDGHDKPVTDDVRTTVFQAVREVFANLIKHAQAKNVWVEVLASSGTLMVQVKDDGVGFVQEEAQWTAHKPSGFGLFNIRERLDYVCGFVSIKSAPGQGTTVTIMAPLATQRLELPGSCATEKQTGAPVGAPA